MFGEIELNVPIVRIKKAIKLYKSLNKAIEKGLVASAHGCYKGGLALALAQSSFAGGYGLEINLTSIPREKLENEDKLLYSESASRFVVTVSKKHEKEFLKIMKGNDFNLVGKVTKDKTLLIKGLKKQVLIKENIYTLKKVWKEPFNIQ